MQRFSATPPVTSPSSPNNGKSTPLAQVKEEATAPIAVHTNGVTSLNNKLVEVSTPRGSDEEKRSEDIATTMEPMSLDDDENKENAKVSAKGLGLMNGKAEKHATVEEDNGMKTIEI